MSKFRFYLLTILIGSLIIGGYMLLTYYQRNVNVGPLLTITVAGLCLLSGFLATRGVILNARQGLTEDQVQRTVLPTTAVLVVLAVTLAVMGLRSNVPIPRVGLSLLGLGVLGATLYTYFNSAPYDEADDDTDDDLDMDPTEPGTQGRQA